jgi:hypothetical protein
MVDPGNEKRAMRGLRGESLRAEYTEIPTQLLLGDRG